MIRPWLLGVLAGSMLALGCTTASSQAVVETPAAGEPTEQRAESDREKRLPQALEDLELSDEQRRELLALRDQLEKDVEPIVSSGRDLLVSVSVALRRCKGDTPMMSMRASSVIASGEQVRPHVLDAVNRFHAILTPKQRLAVSNRLLDREEKSRERRRDDSSTRSFGLGLGLSVSQIVQMLLRLQPVRESFEEKIEPWRDRYRIALEAFADDDFDIRQHDIAEAPAVQILLTTGGEALRVLVPILEPEQCQALADKLDEQLEKTR